MKKVIHRIFRKGWIAWGGLFLFACSGPENPSVAVSPAAVPPIEDLPALNEAPEGTGYWLEWGDRRIPLEWRANPNVYAARVEMDLAEFQEKIDQKLQLFRDRRTLDLELLRLYRPPFIWGSPWHLTDPVFQKGRLGVSERDRLKQSANYGDEWEMSLFSSADSIRIQSLEVRIRDPYAGYEPAVKAPVRLTTGEVHGFQLINQTGRPPLLRIDTADTATRQVLDLYREKDHYQILHVPGFRTRRRLLTDEDRLFHPRDIHRTELLGAVPDWLLLPEFTALESDLPVLQWGEMEADPNSPNYALSYFREQTGRELSLQLGQMELRLLGFHLTLVTRQHYPRTYITPRLDPPALQKDLLKAGEAASVYFDRIIVEDTGGQPMLFPVAFAFHVELQKPYELEIREAEADEPFLREIRQAGGGWALETRATPLSELLAVLYEEKTEDIVLDGFTKEPRVSLSYSSIQFSAEESRDLVRRRLLEKYQLLVERNRGEPVFFLRLQEKERLLPRETQERRRSGFEFMEMRELARVLSGELDAWVVDRTGMASRKFRLTLPRGSLPDIQEKLKELGLMLEPFDREIRMLVRHYQ